MISSKQNPVFDLFTKNGKELPRRNTRAVESIKPASATAPDFTNNAGDTTSPLSLTRRKNFAGRKKPASVPPGLISALYGYRNPGCAVVGVEGNESQSESMGTCPAAMESSSTSQSDDR